MTTIRCSELDRVLLCPGSLTLTRLVAPRQGDEGLEGTWLHWAAHAAMKDAMAAVGNIGPTPPVPSTINFCHWIADYYLRTVQEIVPPDWSIECEVAMAYEFGRFVLSGHIDCLAVSPDATEAIGFDLKTGYDPVDIAESNEQIFGYSVLLLRAYPTLRKITFYIVQPRNDEDEGFQRVSDPPMILEGTRLSNAEAALTQSVNKTLDNAMEVETSMKACKWCAAAMQCPAQIALRESMKATLTKEYLETVQPTPDDARLIEWDMARRTLLRPLDDAHDMLKARIKANGSAVAPDVLATLKTEGGSYEFPEPGKFYRASRTLLPDDDVYAATVKPSVTKTKDAIAKVRGIPKTSKKGESAESVFRSVLGEHCVQGVREKIAYQTA